MSGDTYRRASVRLYRKGRKYSEPEGLGAECPAILPQAMRVPGEKGWPLPAVAQHLCLSE